MAKKDERFVIKNVKGGGFLATTYILVDKETGVNYLYHQSGNAGGLTPLLDSSGKVIVSSSWEWEEE